MSFGQGALVVAMFTIVCLLQLVFSTGNLLPYTIEMAEFLDSLFSKLLPWFASMIRNLFFY